jgi:hypothetical protein
MSLGPISPIISILPTREVDPCCSHSPGSPETSLLATRAVKISWRQYPQLVDEREWRLEADEFDRNVVRRTGRASLR